MSNQIEAIQLDPMGTHGISESSFESFDYELSELEQTCFHCPLQDCKENSKKCLIKRAKKEGLAKIQAEFGITTH